MIFRTVLYVVSHTSNVREGVKLQSQISIKEIVVLQTLLSFEGIVAYNSPLHLIGPCFIFQ
jgi:hypothetical protein